MKRATQIAAIALVAGSALTLSTVVASAHGGKSGMGGKMGRFLQMEFTDVDLDKSGQITVEDLQAMARARFDGADTNGDGKLTPAELKAEMEAKISARMAAGQDGKGARKAGRWAPDPEKRMGWMAERMLEKRDTDKDGALSAAEMMPDQARIDRMIDRFDTDDDNAISAAEFGQAQKEMWMGMKSRKGHGKHGRNGG
ncbi:EF-hand domain-containing protein [Aliiroseovarius crassostreae]|uniref:EF-hand domain-containing protein n=1 Tax=Aliiroseovarius crassostreae TaxID=154981 RepID=UPI003C7AAB33